MKLPPEIISRFCLATAILFFVASLCSAQPVFNVKNYGAAGDGVNLDSPAVNAAIAAAGAAGGGSVTFPQGTYLCGSIHLTNNLTLYLSNNAVIWASATNIDPHESSSYSSYQDQGHTWFHDSLVWGIGLTNLTFAGTGKIDGNGALTTGNPSSNNPGDKALCLVTCSNVNIMGITITNGGHFGILAQACTNMFVHDMNVWEKTSRDGFNLIDSSFVTVSNCIIEGSDDSMCLKSDYALGRKIGGHDIHIMNCTILSTQNNATQFGSETVGDFSNVTFSNLVLTGAGKAGIGVTSQDGAVIDGVTYNNITMSNCACPIFLKLDYRTTDTPNPAVGRIRNISIANVTAVHSSLFSRTNTSTINGYYSTNTLTNVCIQNIMFSNVNVSNIGGHPATDITNYPVEIQDWQPQNFGKWPAYGWYLRWATDISFTNCQVHFDHNDDRPAVIADTVTNVFFNNFSADVGTNNTNYDMGFLNAMNYQVTNATASANAPSPGSTLRISTGASIPPPPPPPVTNFFFEAESIPFVTSGAAAVVQNDPNSSSGQWMALEATQTNNNSYIEYTLAGVPAGTYQLNLKYKGNTERGIITHKLDGVPLGDALDQYSSGQTYPELSLGNFTFTNSDNHTVRQTVIGKNPANTSQPWASADRFALLLLQPPKPMFNGSIKVSNGAVQFSGAGYPTLPYRIEATTNLGGTNWTTVGAASADANGALQFTDTNAAVPPRFYRLVTP
jgi:hypothetical protein